MQTAARRERHNQESMLAMLWDVTRSVRVTIRKESFRTAQQQALLAAGTADLQARRGAFSARLTQGSLRAMRWRRAPPGSWSVCPASCKQPEAPWRWSVPSLCRTSILVPGVYSLEASMYFRGWAGTWNIELGRLMGPDLLRLLSFVASASRCRLSEQEVRKQE